MQEMQEMLKAEAAKHWPHLGTTPTLAFPVYREHIEKNHKDPVGHNCSFFYKVGVYAVLDGNKMDYADVYIGIQRDPEDPPRLLGRLDFSDGENDDPGNIMVLIRNLLSEVHPVFESDIGREE
ncbi:hypothetical protein LCGC14_1306930 [marine sediment metagenome]|uniref:Uncharacterized protein n=1 Tax=marine sediment metagenome TaxID=412755 RepID=A0A0F9L8A2_9ZZZZ